MRVHLFPSRTQKLSSLVPKILGWQRPGKIGKRQLQRVYFESTDFILFVYSSIAQSVERMTVNHDVTGSSPVGGANKNLFTKVKRFFQ